MNPDMLMALLDGVPVFSAIGRANLMAILPVLRQRDLRDGENLYRYGAPGDSLAVILSGQCIVELPGPDGAPIEIRRLGRGEMVGEMACVDPAPRSATVKAIGGARVMELDRTMLTSIHRSSPSVAAKVVGGISDLVCSRIRDTNESVATLVRSLQEGAYSRLMSGGGAPRPAPRPNPVGNLPSVAPASGKARGYPLDASDLQLLENVGVRRGVSDGTLLCEEGKPGDSAFFILQGELEVLKNVEGSLRLLASVTPGGVVGQLALLDSGNRSATLRAKGNVLLLELNRGTFGRLLEAKNPFALRFQEHICITGIRQLRNATQLHGQIEQLLKSQGPGRDGGGEKLKLGYMSAALDEWGMSLEDLDQVVVKTPDGMMTQAELKARSNR